MIQVESGCEVATLFDDLKYLGGQEIFFEKIPSTFRHEAKQRSHSEGR